MQVAVLGMTSAFTSFETGALDSPTVSAAPSFAVLAVSRAASPLRSFFRIFL